MSIETQLIEYFKESLGVEVTETTRLIDEDIIDSMGVVELLTFLAETFAVEFDMDDMVAENLETLPAITALVNSKR